MLEKPSRGIARVLLLVSLSLAGCSVFPASLPDPGDASDGTAEPEPTAPARGKDAGAHASTADGHSGGGGSAAETGDAAPALPQTGECGSNTTRKTCTDCCNANHATGGTQYLQAFGDCTCGTTAPGPCATECANDFCVGRGAIAGSACDACLATASQGACGQTAATACMASAECAAWSACVTDSSCNTKP